MKKLFFSILAIIILTFIIRADEGIFLKDLTSFHYAFMEFTGSYKNYENSFNTFMKEFFSQKLTPIGPPIGVYYNSPNIVKEEELKWAIAFPVKKEAEVKSPLKKALFKTCKVASILHIGPYDQLAKSYDVVMKYIKRNGYKVIWPTFEQYLSDPKKVKPEEYSTDIWIPIKKE